VSSPVAYIPTIRIKIARVMQPDRNVAQDRNTIALAGLRIAVGCLFLVFAEYKVFGTQFTLGGLFGKWINGFLQNGATYPFMVPVLRSFVLPHAKAIAFLVAYSELAIGLSLVLGILVRTASACGLVYMLALLFSSNYPGAQVAIWRYFGASLDHSVLALCFLTFLVGHSDEALSLRRYLFRLGRRTATGDELKSA
jgi:thiosulfate dehydrogenase (quinone) large subunit